MFTFLYLAQCGGGIWRSNVPLIGVTFLYIGFIVKFYNCYVNLDDYTYLQPLSLCLQFFGTLLLAICSYLWCRELYRNKLAGKKLTSDQYCCNVYLLAFWIPAVALWIQMAYLNFPNWYDLNTTILVGENCIYSTYYILITVFEGHAVLMEAITSQVISK